MLLSGTNTKHVLPKRNLYPETEKLFIFYGYLSMAIILFRVNLDVF